MQMNIELKPNVKKQCSFCSHTLCYLNSVIVNEEILELLKCIIKSVDLSVLLDLLICRGCLEQINNAKHLIIAIQKSQRTLEDVKIEEETCDNNFVTCCICKASVKKESLVPFLDSPYIQDVVSDNLKEALENVHDLEICESCQSSMISFDNILNLILVHCLTKTSNDSSEITTRGQIDIKEEHLSENFNGHDSIIQSVSVKNEPEVDTNEESVGIHDDFQIKQEEVYVKMECEDEPVSDARMEGTEQDSNALDKMLHYQISEQQIGYKKDINCTEVHKCHICMSQTKHKSNLKRHMLIHKNINEVETYKPQIEYKKDQKSKDINYTKAFKCPLCKFQTKYKDYLKRHIIIHKDISEVEIFKCHLCKFQTKRKGSLKNHILTHTNINEVDAFKCHLCNYQAKHKKVLNSHLLIHEALLKVEKLYC